MNYKKQLYRFDTAKINNLALYLFLLSFLPTMAINLFVLKKPLFITQKFYFDILLSIGVFIVGLISHEGLHALAAIIFGKCGAKNIKFGINLKQGMLYCHLDKPITAKAYSIVLIIPIIITGLIPLIIVTIIGNIFLVVVFCMLLCGGAGDIIMLIKLQKINKTALILDHPIAPAFYTLYDSDNLPSDFREVTAEEEEQLLKDMNTSPKSIYNGKKNVMLTNLAILLFLSLATLIVFVIGILMSFL